MIGVDTNVLVYAHRVETDRHVAANRRLTALVHGAEPWGLPVFVLGEFLRVVTHTATVVPPTPRVEALRFLGALTGSPSARVLYPVDGFLDVLASVITEAKVAGNAVFDAQIVAVCRQHGVDEILSEDLGLRRFAGIRPVPLPTKSE